MTSTTTKRLRVEEGRLYVPHQGKDIIFIHPSHGPNTYAGVQESIERAGLHFPTLAETVSLAHAAFQSADKYSAEIKELMKKQGLFSSAGILYVPREGAYIQDHPEVCGGLPSMNRSDLVKKLEASDPTVRFVPFGFKTERMSSYDLASNLFIRGLVGLEGAEKLAEIADKHPNQPYLCSYASVNQPITRVSTLRSGWGEGLRLRVNGDRGVDRYSYAFGVRKSTGEASRAEK